MRALELFCGTKSFSKELDYAWEVISLDNRKSTEPTFCCDIMDFDFKQYPVGYFDMIWASPPCTEYSICKQNAPRKLELADSIVKKTLEIIRYLKPKLWFIENPQTGLLKSREFMKDIPFVDMDYCRFSDWGYRKRTRFWTNKQGLITTKCLGRGKCPNMIEKRHKRNIGNARKKYGIYKFTKSDKYRIPPKLIRYLVGL